MKWFTEESVFYPGYRMPLVCNQEPSFPPSTSGGPFFQVLLLIEGALALGAGKQHSFLKAPIVACMYDIPDVTVIDRRRPKLFHLVFQAPVVNGRYNDASKIPRSLPSGLFEEVEYSMFAPFFSTGARLASYSGNARTLARLEELFARLHDILASPRDRMWPCRSRSYFLELLAQLYRMSIEVGSDDATLTDTGTVADRVASYVHTHYNEDMTLESLAARFGTNRTSLNSWFKEQFKNSVISYLANVRLRTACNLLRNTELPIAEVAERSGFRDPVTMWRAFKKTVDMTPRQYRHSFPSPYDS